MKGTGILLRTEQQLQISGPRETLRVLVGGIEKPDGFRTSVGKINNSRGGGKQTMLVSDDVEIKKCGKERE